MIKMLFLCTRRSEISHERYAELVLQGHVPLALKHHPTMRRYAVNIADATPGGGEPFDSMAALYFDSLEDYRERLYDSPEGQAIIGRDVEGFLGGADAYATRELVHKDESPRTPLGERTPGVKQIILIKRHPELSREQFVAHWREVHVPLVLEQLPRLVRYVTNEVEMRVSESGVDWDGIAEFSFAGPGDATGTAQSQRLRGADTTRFTSLALAYPVSEYVQK